MDRSVRRYALLNTVEFEYEKLFITKEVMKITSNLLVTLTMCCDDTAVVLMRKCKESALIYE